MNQCPRCKGKGGGDAFVSSSDGCSMRRVACDICKGAGEITDERMSRYLEGRMMRATRIALRKTLREAALELGITAARLSAMERGDA